MLARLGTAIGLLALCAISILRVTRPPAPVPATSSDTVFSAERALRHVEQIAVRPHPMGSADHDRVRDYITGQLTQFGAKPQIQRATAIGTRYQEAGRVQNILSWLPGGDTKGKAVLLVAHYDGVGAGPAASDDGAGSAALLETVRALRARKQPLAHDVIVLFTDGEEAGLLGAAAFVREHPWAKDVAVILNFEARGTSGRSFMFETGPGNRDAVSALRAAGDATAGSTFTTIYRALPNDTDLSEFAVLGLPALNFAFADGVERYHTSRDDVAHLNPGSLQHHGAQMFSLARTFASETLPRPTTGDAVFFDLPVVGLVIYPEGLALPIAIVLLLLTAAVVVRVRRGILVGASVTIVALLLSGGAAFVAGNMFVWLQSHLPRGGSPMFSAWYAGAMAALSVAITLSCIAFARRWSDARGLHVGALVIWTLLAIGISIKAPGVSYLFVWSALFVALSLLVARLEKVALWIAAVATLLLLPGLLYGASVIMLGIVGVGAIALGVLTSLVVALLAPLMSTVSGASRWLGARWFAGAAVVLALIGAFVVRNDADHPIPTALLYVQNADSSDAWLGAPRGRRDPWTRQAIGEATSPPAWAARLSNGPLLLAARKVERVPLDAPNVVFIRDTLINGARRVVLRVTAPRGATSLVMRASGAPVLTSSIDGRVIDTTRFRYRLPAWTMRYWAVPDTGAIVALSIPAGSKIDFELVSRVPGIPSIPGTTIPPRPADVVPAQDGDVSVVYKKRTF
jgi:hypothetical protein